MEVATAEEPARRAEIFRVNRVMRGTSLPAGRHRLVYRYRPASFLIGSLVSVVGWIVLLCCGALGLPSAWRSVRRSVGRRLEEDSEEASE